MTMAGISNKPVINGTRHELPQGWRWAKLGEVAIYINGRAFKPEDWGTSGLPIIRIQNLNTPDAPFNYFDSHVDSRYLVNNEDLLISWSASLDAYMWRRGPAILNQHIFRVAEDPTVISREYLYFAAREAMGEIRAQVHGTTMQHITRPEFEAIQIPLPALAEQRRITALLIAQMAAVERARQAAEAQVDAAKALPIAYLRTIFTSSTAQQWPRKRLAEITELVSGGTPSRGNTNYFKGTIPWVKTLDLNLSIVQTTEECISEAALEAIRGDILPPETVMVAMYGGAGTIGKSGILGISAATNQAVCSILPNHNVFVPDYLHAWLLLIRPEWMKYSGGNRKDPNINKGIVERMEIPLPSLAEQGYIALLLADQMAIAQRVRTRLIAQLDTINQLPASILRQAFSGAL